MECCMFKSKNYNQEKYKIFADYCSTGLWFFDDKSGVWLSCDPSKDMSSEFKQTLHDWMLYYKADRIRSNLGVISGCISLRMFNAIGQTLAQQLHHELRSSVFYQSIKENELFCNIINDQTHIDTTIKI